MNPGRIMLRWVDRSGFEFGAHQLSDGSLRLIALVTALLQPRELLPQVIVIDEPELGLHPAGVRLIADLIKAVAADRQVIVATQSPKLVSEISVDDILVVERAEDELQYGYTTVKHLDREQLQPWLEDFDLGTLYDMNVTGGGPQ